MGATAARGHSTDGHSTHGAAACEQAAQQHWHSRRVTHLAGRITPVVAEVAAFPIGAAAVHVVLAKHAVKAAWCKQGVCLG